MRRSPRLHGKESPTPFEGVADFIGRRRRLDPKETSTPSKGDVHFFIRSRGYLKTGHSLSAMAEYCSFIQSATSSEGVDDSFHSSRGLLHIESSTLPIESRTPSQRVTNSFREVIDYLKSGPCLFCGRF